MTRAEYQRRAKATWRKRQELARLRIWLRRYNVSMVSARCEQGHLGCSIYEGGPCAASTRWEIMKLEAELGTKKGGGNDPA
jgi:hypothetical protein